MAHGEINHIEFPADDPERAMAFYSAVAGWEFSAMDGMPDYWVFRSGEGYGGAVGKRGVSTGQVVRDYIDLYDLQGRRSGWGRARRALELGLHSQTLPRTAALYLRLLKPS